MQSFGVSLVIDLVVFELVPALVFGSLGLLVVQCRCSCCLCLLMWLELYRFFRNIAA